MTKKLIKEKWNENVEECSGCGIKWKKIGKQCPVCFEPAEKHTTPMYQCQSIWNGETNQLENCTCGRCADALKKSKENIKKTYYKVTPEGDKSYCVFTKEQVKDGIADWLDGADEGFKLVVEEIKMTEKQYEKLPDYEG